MLGQPTNGPNDYIRVVFCRKDFLKVVDKSWVNNDFPGLDATKLLTYASTDDIGENFVLSIQAYRLEELKVYGSNQMYAINDDAAVTDIRVHAYNSKYMSDRALDYLYGRNDFAVLDGNLVDDQYELLVKGDILFIGIEPGFVVQMADRSKEREFLLNCLGMCRTAMQNPAIILSPLYRRFVFSNVNV